MARSSWGLGHMEGWGSPSRPHIIGDLQGGSTCLFISFLTSHAAVSVMGCLSEAGALAVADGTDVVESPFWVCGLHSSQWCMWKVCWCRGWGFRPRDDRCSRSSSPTDSVSADLSPP